MLYITCMLMGNEYKVQTYSRSCLNAPKRLVEPLLKYLKQLKSLISLKVECTYERFFTDSNLLHSIDEHDRIALYAISIIFLRNACSLP